MHPVTLTYGLLAALLPASLAQSTAAQVVSGNPSGAQYIATLPNNSNKPNGNIVVSSAPDGNGVNVQVSINNLPATSGPFLYHIHALPVSTDGNCTSAGGHLDPYNVGEAVLCDPKDPQNCQVGDLSGKYGAMTNGTSFAANYVDKYICTQPGTPAFVGNRSVVVHFANKTRLTCANFTTPGGSSSSSSGSSAPVVVMPAAGPATSNAGTGQPKDATTAPAGGAGGAGTTAILVQTTTA